MVLCLYWAKAEQKGTSRCRSQRAPRVPPAEGSLVDFLCNHHCFVLPKSVTRLFTDNHAICLFIHRLLQLWKLSFPPPKSGMKKTGWAPRNEMTHRIWGTQNSSQPGSFGSCCRRQNHMETCPGSKNWEPACASEAAGAAWPGVPHWNEAQSCPAGAGADAQERPPAISGRKWDSTLAHPSACTPSRLDLHLWSPFGSFCHQLHGISAQYQPVCSTNPGDSRGSQHTFYYCVDSNKVHHLHFGHGVEIVWNHEGRFSSVLWTMKNRIMHLFNNQSCVRCNNFQFLFLVYLPVFKKYSIKRKCCSKEGFNYTYLFIASARVHKTAFYALMLIKFLGTSPDTLIVFQSKWVSIKEISLGL